jgi:hypothetical protein
MCTEFLEFLEFLGREWEEEWMDAQIFTIPTFDNFRVYD